ncbi:dihydrolipoyl dehydrogenase [Acetobacterium wieringae]|uniref:dihydrolipoyl dehydrogenase n=1 Tax=Acetobacterium wieringae TaxID=52694 RepID=UPI00203344DC|nr:dihydrolipoyl dehydrogenase [Acetobacterium wieringae]URN84568.1 dihydrolipoyl dehydrogenase [Acetobacterium wieringae]
MTHLAIIGGGPGGYVAAIRAAQLGAQVTLIEKDKLGGTCLNVGCIPTKALLHSAEVLTEAKNSAQIGLIIPEAGFDWTKIQKHKEQISTKLSGGVKGLLKANGVKIITGTAQFLSDEILLVTEPSGKTDELRPDKIIIASGSIPALPPIPGINHPDCIDSTGALSLAQVPESLVIIGGVIGVEMASVYNQFGSKVTIVEMQPGILPLMDGELGEMLRKKLMRDGIEILTGTQVVSIDDNDNKVTVNINKDGNNSAIIGEKVLVAIGRKAELSTLGLDNTSIKTDKKGILVNPKMQTNAPNIYAIGDCLGKTMLAHVASQQGEVAAENALGHEAIYDEKTNPSCVYTNPEFASVGLTQEDIRGREKDYSIGRFPLAANGKSLIMGSTEGMIKIISDKKYKEVVGVHILGPRATDLIVEGALALRLESTVEEIISTIHAHPTVGEAIKEAALATENRAIHWK